MTKALVPSKIWRAGKRRQGADLNYLVGVTNRAPTMAMPKMPKASPAAVERFEALLPSSPEVTVKKVFGQPAAFLGGNMFMGVFGEQVFVRLSEEGLASAAKIPGVRAFEPMPGRPMRGYAVLPEALLSKPKAAAPWVKMSVEYVKGLPPKSSGARKPARPRPG